MKKYLDDLFVFIGCGLIVYATYRINVTAALYVAGVFFILVGILFGLGIKKG